MKSGLLLLYNLYYIILSTKTLLLDNLYYSLFLAFFYFTLPFTLCLFVHFSAFLCLLPPLRVCNSHTCFDTCFMRHFAVGDKLQHITHTPHCTLNVQCAPSVLCRFMYAHSTQQQRNAKEKKALNTWISV